MTKRAIRNRARAILRKVRRQRRRITKRQRASLVALAIALAPSGYGSKATFVDWDAHGNTTCAYIYFTKSEIPTMLCSNGTFKRIR